MELKRFEELPVKPVTIKKEVVYIFDSEHVADDVAALFEQGYETIKVVEQNG